jgi:hypothetical protein
MSGSQETMSGGWPAVKLPSCTSPTTRTFPRQQEIMRVDEISPDRAAAKLRVRIGQTCFLEQLILHGIDGKWLVTSNGFHVEQVLPPGS